MKTHLKTTLVIIMMILLSYLLTASFMLYPTISLNAIMFIIVGSLLYNMYRLIYGFLKK
jgi:hypothetical protein